MPHCGAGNQGSTSQQLCEAWSATKAALKRCAGTAGGRTILPGGTRELPYPENVGIVRRLVWNRIKSAVMRRDR